MEYNVSINDADNEPAMRRNTQSAKKPRKSALRRSLQKTLSMLDYFTINNSENSEKDQMVLLVKIIKILLIFEESPTAKLYHIYYTTIIKGLLFDKFSKQLFLISIFYYYNPLLFFPNQTSLNTKNRFNISPYKVADCFHYGQ